MTVSNIERQDVLNNNYALQAIQDNLDVNSLHYRGELLFTTKMVADFYDVDEHTIKRYVQDHGDELRANGYFLNQGKDLKDIKIEIGRDIYVTTKTTILSFFTFRAFLNIGMLLTESEKAKQLRTRILILLFLLSTVVLEEVPNTLTGEIEIIFLQQSRVKIIART